MHHALDICFAKANPFFFDIAIQTSMDQEAITRSKKIKVEWIKPELITSLSGFGRFIQFDMQASISTNVDP
jgi:hypothetical protein